MSTINNFHVIGEMRNAITEIQSISPKHEGGQRYLLQFDIYSKWANRKMEIEINPEKLVLLEVQMSENSAEYGNYTISTLFDVE